MPAKGQYKPGPPIGSVIGKLQVIGIGEPIQDGKGRASTSVCRCQCGTVVTIRNYVLRRPITNSCGCTRKHGAARRNAKRSRTYNLYHNMLTRCRRDPRYSKVTICTQWKTSYTQFLADMGECPAGLTLDRIDNTKGYSPSNCRWATTKEQNNNRRNNHRVTFNGETKTITEWMEHHNMNKTSFYRRLKHGWSEEDAAGLPKYARRRPRSQ